MALFLATITPSIVVCIKMEFVLPYMIYASWLYCKTFKFMKNGGQLIYGFYKKICKQIMLQKLLAQLHTYIISKTCYPFKFSLIYVL